MEKQRGFGIIAFIILAALLFAAFNVYAYYNPGFSLSKYSPSLYIHRLQDNQKKKDLAAYQQALEKYFNDHDNTYPGQDGFCGRIVSVTYDDALQALTPYFPKSQLPQDPNFKGTAEDYFYVKLPNENYALMAALNVPNPIPADQLSLYNFKGCHDWPGDNIYNYRLDSPEH